MNEKVLNSDALLAIFLSGFDEPGSPIAIDYNGPTPVSSVAAWTVNVLRLGCSKVQILVQTEDYEKDTDLISKWVKALGTGKEEFVAEYNDDNEMRLLTITLGTKKSVTRSKQEGLLS